MNRPGSDRSAARAAQDLTVMLSRMRRRLQLVATPEGLTPSQRSVLSRLAMNGPASASELAVAERVRPQSMAATLSALFDQKMIKREPDPKDGRRYVISLTDLATETIAGSRRERQEWLEHELENQFDEAQRQTIIEAMALINRIADA